MNSSTVRHPSATVRYGGTLERDKENGLGTGSRVGRDWLNVISSAKSVSVVVSFLSCTTSVMDCRASSRALRVFGGCSYSNS
jgi:hypothetical protein